VILLTNRVNPTRNNNRHVPLRRAVADAAQTAIIKGKRFELRAGIVQARVAPQPPGESLRIKTPHARATVLGTEFLLRADEETTRLDVLEGKVQLACRTTGKKVTVKAGFAASMKTDKSAFNVTPLCSSNCILRECRGTNAESKFQKLKAKDEK
jgi:hypothetical protein